MYSKYVLHSLRPEERQAFDALSGQLRRSRDPQTGLRWQLPTRFWTARFDIGRDLSLKRDDIAQCRRRLSNRREMANRGGVFEST